MKNLICTLLAALCWSAALAQDRAIEQPPVRYTQFHVTHVVHDDGTSTEHREWRMVVQQAQALEWAKTSTIHHSTSVQQVEVLQAYTLKADGRRIDVPKGNYQVQTSLGRDSGSPAFSDFSSISVVFPDLAVGDTVALAYRMVQTEPIFPGHFDAGYTFGRETAFDDVQLSVTYPAALKVRYAGRQMAQTESVLPDGRKRVQWQWANPQPQRSARQDYSVVYADDEPGAAFSTFDSHAAIAAAYGVRALPKAAPTERVRTLAQQIVGDRREVRDQARALYDWVSTQVTYGGNCVGVGTVVPRDLDKVLDNRMGDCKDHATLLQALLAARGIASEQVLVNAGNGYRLQAIPLVSAVNHVMNYLPDLKLYVDATAKHQPFGVLPPPLRGKPALHVDRWRDGAVTPVPALARSQTTDSRLKLAADGSLSGTVTVQYRGDAAIGMRQWARQLPQESRPDMVRDLLRSMGLSGQGSVDLPDATALDDSYQLTLKLDRVDRFVRLPGPGGFHVMPLAGGTTVGNMVQGTEGEPVQHDTACTNGVAEENYEIELPKGLTVTGLPPAARLASSVQRYEASTTRKGQTLLIRRRLEDRTPVAVCPPAIGNEYRRLGPQVIDHLKAQVLYR
jgi:transglutaminase-like putative cysteine protease